MVRKFQFSSCWYYKMSKKNNYHLTYFDLKPINNFLPDMAKKHGFGVSNLLSSY